MEQETKYLLRVSCTGISSMVPVNLKNNPFCILYVKNEKNEFEIVSHTETIEHSVNPCWIHHFNVKRRDVDSDVQLYFKIFHNVVGVIHEQTPNANLNLGVQKLVGELRTSLTRILGKNNNVLKVKLNPGSDHYHKGDITIQAQDLNTTILDRFSFQFKGLKFKIRKKLSKTLMHFVVEYKANKDDKVATLRTTPVGYNRKTKSFNWSKLTVETRFFCNADEHQPLQFSFYAQYTSGQNELGPPNYIGGFNASVVNILAHNTFIIERKKKKVTRKVGEIHVVPAPSLERRASFLQYAQAENCEISLMIGIDFTKSNRNPSEVSSLHHINPRWKSGLQYMNQYQRVIETIGRVICQYDKDGKVPVFGFGGKFNGEHRVNHAYPLNGDPNDAEVDGIDEVLTLYDKSISDKSIELYGPTYLRPIIEKALVDVDRKSSINNYHVLLIITDDDYEDVDAVAGILLNSAYKPLTTIIVGVGDSNFQHMERFDKGKLHLDINATPTARHTTQFIHFKKYHEKPNALRDVALEKVSDNVVEYFAKQNILPDESGRVITKHQIPKDWAAVEKEYEETHKDKNIPFGLPVVQTSRFLTQTTMPRNQPTTRRNSSFGEDHRAHPGMQRMLTININNNANNNNGSGGNNSNNRTNAPNHNLI